MAQAQVRPSACAASPSRGSSCSARVSGMRAEGACSATALRTCRRLPAITGMATQTRPSKNSSASVA